MIQRTKVNNYYTQFSHYPLHIFSISDKKISENTDDENDNKTINDPINDLIESINEMIKDIGKYDKFQLLYAITSLSVTYTVFSTS